MPLKVSVGLTKKVGQPDYGSLGASCHVEYEADGALLFHDLETFQSQVKLAFVACRQAVQDELDRQAGGRSSQTGTNGRQAANGRGENQQRGTARKATASQVRAINAIAERMQLDLAAWLCGKFGLNLASDLSVSDASDAIDELKALPAANSNGGRR